MRAKEQAGLKAIQSSSCSVVRSNLTLCDLIDYSSLSVGIL